MLHHSLIDTASGQGPPLILLHGLFGTGDNLSMVAKPLAEFFTVYQLDLRNHGRSPHSSSMSYAEMAQDVLAFMDQQGIAVADLLGHSMGGKVAMQLALSHPARVRRLVVADIAPVAYGGRHVDIFAGLNSVVLSSLASRRDADVALKAHIDDSGVRAFLLKSLYRNNEGQFDWRFNLAALQQCYHQIAAANDAEQAFAGRCLFIKAEHSNYLLAEYLPAIKQLFNDPQFKIIQNTSHWLHAEKPVAFVRLVRQFLSRS